MKISIAQSTTLFQALGSETADKWDATKHNSRLEKLAAVYDDPKTVDTTVLKDKPEAKKLFDQCVKAFKKNETVTIEEAAPAADAPAASGKGSAFDEEKPEAKAKGRKATPAAATPAKGRKAASAKPAAESKVKRNKFGSIEGSSNAAVDAALTKKPQTFAELVKASKLTTATLRYAHLEALVKAKHAVEVEAEGKRAWKLA